MKSYFFNTNQKKLEQLLIILDQADFIRRIIIKDKKGTHKMLKGCKSPRLCNKPKCISTQQQSPKLDEAKDNRTERKDGKIHYYN